MTLKGEIKMTYYVGNMPVGDDELMHYGTKGMRWGQRRFQNRDGSLTAAGRLRYGWGRAKAGASRAYGRAVRSSKKFLGSPKKRKQFRQKLARGAAIAGSAAAVGALGYAAYKHRGFAKAAKKAAGSLRTFNIPNRPRLGTGAKTFDAGRLRFVTRAKNTARNGFTNARNTASTLGGKAKNVFRKKRAPYGAIHPGQARLTGGPSFDGSRLKRSTVLKNRANTVRNNVKNRINTASIERSRRKGMKTGLVVGGPVKGGRTRSATAQRIRDRLGYEKARVENAARNITSKGRGYKKGSSAGRFGGKSDHIRSSRTYKNRKSREAFVGGVKNVASKAGPGARRAGAAVGSHLKRNRRVYTTVGATAAATAAAHVGARKRGRSKRNARIAGASMLLGGVPGYAAYRVGDRIANGNWGGYTRKRKKSSKKSRR